MTNNNEPRPPKAMALTLKYRENQEYLLRRLGQALVLQWDELPDGLQDVLIDQAAGVTDREEDTAHSAGDIETFIRSVKSVATPPPAREGDKES
jgi:hypothetical protein